MGALGWSGDKLEQEQSESPPCWVTSGDVNTQAPMLGSWAETLEAGREEHMCVQIHTHACVGVTAGGDNAVRNTGVRCKKVPRGVAGTRGRGFLAALILEERARLGASSLDCLVGPQPGQALCLPRAKECRER